MTGTSDRRLCLGAVADAEAQAWRRRLVLRGSQSWPLLNGGPLGSLTRAIALSAAALLVLLLVGWGLAGAEDVEGDAIPETALTLESTTPTSLTVTWDDVPNATLYSVRWRLTGQSTFSPSYAATGGRYQITGLLPGRNYRVRIEVSGGSGVVFRILGGTWRTPLTTPRNLTVTAATADSLSLSWTEPDGWNPAGYRLSWRKPSDAQFQGSVKLAGSATSYMLSGLNDQTQYVVNLLALNANGDGSLDVAATAYAVDPLAITLTSSRKLCTANTLTELTWEITGGLKPHRLFIDGKKIDLDNVESHRVNCGPLTLDSETGEPLPEQNKTFSAVAKDHRGLSSSAESTLDLAQALTPPSILEAVARRTEAVVIWHAAAGDVEEDTRADYLIRWRLTGGEAWSYEQEFRFLGPAFYPIPEWNWRVEDLQEGTAYEFELAAMRDPLERLTPEALSWGERTPLVTYTDPTNIVTTSTHDTVTVTWVLGRRTQWPPPVWIERSGGGQKDPQTASVSEDEGRAVFTGLLPDSDYSIFIYTADAAEQAGQGARAYVSVRTKSAPADWVRLPTGPKNVQTAATHNSITLSWDHAHDDARQLYRYYFRETESGRKTHYVGVVNQGPVVFNELFPETSYTITLVHYGIQGRTAEERTVTTMAAPDAGGAAVPANATIAQTARWYRYFLQQQRTDIPCPAAGADRSSADDG
ncbi:MAG: fibronectin type III domain-containing protein [Chloroflexi bacterium]|nr:fibronectin type III domain-containing protein [Chloroflexota bacterium]